MKILIATDCYLFNLGGITASVLALCAGLRRKGHEVKVLSTSNCNQSFRNGDDYFIRSFPAFYYPGMRISFAMRDPLLRELEEWGPDIIHVQTEGSALRFSLRIMRHCKVPLVMTGHTDYGFFVFGRLRFLPPVKTIMALLGGLMYRHASVLTVPSQKAAGFPFVQKLRSRMTIIPNGIELEKYQKKLSATKRQSFRLSIGIEDSTGVLVSVSRISKEKNIRELISFLPGLLKKRQDVKLLILGDGPDKSYLEKTVKKLKLRDKVLFTGRIPSDEVWRYYAASDIFVSASTFEVHSMSYLEAMAGGLPLLCREDEALLGVLDEGINGHIYHSKKEFVNYAFKMLSDDGYRLKLAKASLQKAESFSNDVFADAMLRVYEDVRDTQRMSELHKEN